MLNVGRLVKIIEALGGLAETNAVLKFRGPNEAVEIHLEKEQVPGVGLLMPRRP